MAHYDPEIKKMRRHFICVRLTRMNGVDLRRFEFDYDTTWNAFFLDERLNIYSRYGGRDAGDPEARLSQSSLLQTMREVLAAHATREDRNQSSQQPLTQPLTDGPPRTPKAIPLLKKNHNGCVHCHQVREYRLLQAYHDGTFTRDQLFPYPLPENIGLKFDREHGHRIAETIHLSPAKAAGLQPGDVVVQVDDVPIHSEYDVRWALQRHPDERPLVMIVLREQDEGAPQRRRLELNLTGDWRQTDVAWRKSLRSVPVPLGIRGYSLTRSQRREYQLTEEQLALRIVSVRDIGLAKNLGVQRKDIIVALAGADHSRTFEQFQSDLLRHFQPDDLVRLTVLRDGKRLTLEGPFPNWWTEETSVP